MDLAGQQLEVDVVEREHAGEGLPDPGHPDDRRHSTPPASAIASSASRFARLGVRADRRARAQGVAGLERGDDLPVLGRGVAGRGDRERQVGALHQPVDVQPAVHLGHEGVPRQVDDLLVEGLVREQIGLLVDQHVVAHRRQRRLQGDPQAGELRRLRDLHGLLNREELERRADVMRLPHQLGCDRAHDVPAPGAQHEPLADEPCQRVVDGRAGYPELVRQVWSPSRSFGPNWRGEQPLAHPGVGLLVQVEANEGLDGDRRCVVNARLGGRRGDSGEPNTSHVT